MRDNTSFAVTKYQYRSSKVSGEGFRIAHLSDLHEKSYGDQNISLILAIIEAKPDLVICSGDMITADGKEDYSQNPAYSLLRFLGKNYPTYYGLGNHEARMYRQKNIYGNWPYFVKKKIESFGIHYMDDDHELAEINGNKLAIFGLNAGYKYYKRFKNIEMKPEYLGKKLGEDVVKTIESEAEGKNLDLEGNGIMNLLIAHNPDYFKAYAAWGADITFSGHLHGAVVQIPGVGGLISPQFHLFPKYSGGIYYDDSSEKAIVVSKGLGQHSMPIRINCRPELVLVDVKPEESKA